MMAPYHSLPNVEEFQTSSSALDICQDAESQE